MRLRPAPAGERFPTDAVVAVHPPLLSLVLPIFNGAHRLPATLRDIDAFRRECGVPLELILVDDGSGPEAAAVLDAFAASRWWVTVLRNDRNRGKGYAVARGMRTARGAFRVFTDADLAYPLDQVLHVFRALEAGADVVVANRMHPETRYTVCPQDLGYHVVRHTVSRMLNGVVRATLVPGVHDTQAGLKGFTAAAAAHIFERTTIERFAFDVEVLLLARRGGLRIDEIPVTLRDDRGGTTVRFVRDTVSILRDVLAMTQRLRRGEYDERVDVVISAPPVPATAPRLARAV